jgi:DNA polymerase sigma
VPIIKCHIKVPSSTLSLKIDISLGVDNGVKAVEAILGYMRAMPPLRPLVLVAKSLVKVDSTQA